MQSAILAGVVSHDFRVPLHYARDGQAAFDSLAADCVADSLCSRAFPRFREEFSSLLEELRRSPARVALPAPDGSADTAVITRDIFAEQIRTQLYRPGAASRIPLIVHRAAAGDFLPFAETIVPAMKPPSPDNIANGHFLAVTCAEDLARISEREAVESSAGTFLGDYRVRQQLNACRLWPAARLPRDHFEPARSTVPVLVISGAADPVTPPMWGEKALRHLPNGRHVIFPDGGHVPFNTSCAASIVAAFVEANSVQTLDVSCVAQYTRPPFVIEYQSAYPGKT